MRTPPSWHEYFMDIAHTAATRSKDPSTQVGAVLVDDDHNIISTGYNGFAPGAPDTYELWNGGQDKYDRVLHAELNCVARAAKAGRPTNGATIYVTHYPCAECAKVIAAAGIKAVFAQTVMQRWDPGKTTNRLTEAGIKYYLMEHVK